MRKNVIKITLKKY